MNDYKGQPLIYVANQSQYEEIKRDTDFYDADKSVIFVGNPRIIDTHDTVYYCASSNIDIESINSRLNNIAGSVNRLEQLLNGPTDEDNNNLADFLDFINSLKDGAEVGTQTIITTINNNLADIDFWYTYEELQAN